MNKYVTRRVVVEAIQIDSQNVQEVAAWCGGKLYATWPEYHYIELRVNNVFIVGSIGEWMIKDVNGNISVCKPDVFEATYEILKQIG